MKTDMRLQTLTIQQERRLITETCSACGILYAMDEQFQRERQADKRMFYCPNGHGQSYTGKSEAQKLREQLEEERRQRQSAEQRIAMWQDEYDAAAKEAEHQKRRANGYKGHATKITKRAKAGVCPCCNRSFENLRRHMATKHPTFTPITLEQGAEATVQ